MLARLTTCLVAWTGPFHKLSLSYSGVEFGDVCILLWFWLHIRCWLTPKPWVKPKGLKRGICYMHHIIWNSKIQHKGCKIVKKQFTFPLAFFKNQFDDIRFEFFSKYFLHSASDTQLILRWQRSPLDVYPKRMACVSLLRHLEWTWGFRQKERK